MTLASDVRDGKGHLLIAAGTALTTRHIHGLHVWGIAEVQVDEGEDELESETGHDAPPEARAAIDPQIELEVRQRFQRSNCDHPFIEELLDHCLHRATQGKGR